MLKNAILIAGPTASGKSALALRIARETGGTIVNADSMQVYSVLDRLTARPQAADIEAVPHRLYGHVHPAKDYSTGHWLRDAGELIERGEFAGRKAVFCGGTGLYFKALLEGLSRMPDVPAAIRAGWRQRLADEGPEKLHEVLARDDPGAAAKLAPGDGQRIVRALEVFEASGRSILDWQRDRGSPLVDPSSATMILIEPDRAELDRRIVKRFTAMLDEGAADEVRALLALGLDAAKPAMKAIGVREIEALLRGEATPAQAIENARIATRQYAKRQMTWFRNQTGPAWQKISDPGQW